jgi:hypothetical protein
MSIEDRNLKAGTKLVATYKKQEFSCEVVKTKDGVVYRLADGQEFKSLSSAGSAVMGGSACNGWRFWTLASEAKAKAESSASQAPKTPKAEQTIKPMKGDPTRFWCSACMDSFPITEGETPTACPQGHTNAPAEEAPKVAKKTTKAPAKRKVAAKAKD